MSITVSDLVTRVEKRLRMVAGVSAQLYAEDTILHSIQTAFDRLFIMRWWSHYCAWSTWTLDGTTGKVTTDLSALIKEYTDIQRIYYESDATPLKRLPANTNPDTIASSDRARYWEPLSQAPTRVFRVLPIDAAGTLKVRYRTKPDDFAIDDTIYLDPLLLELAAALDYLVSDNANPTMIELVRSMLTSHYATVDAMHDDDEVELAPYSGAIPAEWYSAI